MTDRTEIATRLVLQKAVLDLLKDADAETRDVAKFDYTPGAADPVELEGVPLGRVRMDRGRKSATVTDWAALMAFCEEHCPDMLVRTLAINPAFLAAVKRCPEWTDPETGEVLEVPGVHLTESAPILTVTTTDAAEAWARRALTSTLGYSLAPELTEDL